MHWHTLVHVGMWAAEKIGHAVEARQRNRESSPALGSGDFPDRMRACILRHGYRVTGAGADHCKFMVEYDGWQYETAAGLNNDRVVAILMSSNVQFPRRRLPADVTQMLDAMNPKIPNCEYGTLHYADCSVFIAKCGMELANLGPAPFERAVRELLSRVAALDQHLEDEGYRRS